MKGIDDHAQTADEKVAKLVKMLSDWRRFKRMIDSSTIQVHKVQKN
jgi:hypothetical protein